MALIFISPAITHGAGLFFEQKGIDTDGNLLIDIFVDTVQKNPLNAAGASILFNKDIFSIEQIDTTDSIFNFWTEEPRINNTGEIKFSGGTSGKGGFIFEGKLFSLTAKPTAFGDGDFSFLDGEILAADGVGTNILNKTNNLSYTHEEAIPTKYDTDLNGIISIQELSVGLISDA